MTRVTKYLYPWVLQGLYSGGWEDLTQEDDVREIRARRREYVNGEGGVYRIRRRRVPNPQWTGLTPAPRYKVVRYYRNRPGVQFVIASRLTLDQAQAYCRDPETSSSTATSEAAARRTKRYGPWFVGYEQH
jgi:hypothetical protein